VEQFCNVYLIQEMMLNNQTHVKKLFLKLKGERGQKWCSKRGGEGEKGVDECVIQTAHKISALRHVLNCNLYNRNNRNTTEVFKIYWTESEDGVNTSFLFILTSKKKLRKKLFTVYNSGRKKMETQSQITIIKRQINHWLKIYIY